jgi:hypothetical protein
MIPKPGCLSGLAISSSAPGDSAMGPKVVLIKRGEYGVLQFSDSSVFATPA